MMCLVSCGALRTLLLGRAAVQFWKQKEHFASVVHFRDIQPEELIQFAPELQQSEAMHLLKNVKDLAESARLHRAVEQTRTARICPLSAPFEQPHSVSGLLPVKQLPGVVPVQGHDH